MPQSRLIGNTLKSKAENSCKSERHIYSITKKLKVLRGQHTLCSLKRPICGRKISANGVTRKKRIEAILRPENKKSAPRIAKGGFSSAVSRKLKTVILHFCQDADGE